MYQALIFIFNTAHRQYILFSTLYSLHPQFLMVHNDNQFSFMYIHIYKYMHTLIYLHQTYFATNKIIYYI